MHCNIIRKKRKKSHKINFKKREYFIEHDTLINKIFVLNKYESNFYD